MNDNSGAMVPVAGCKEDFLKHLKSGELSLISKIKFKAPKIKLTLVILFTLT